MSRLDTIELGVADPHSQVKFYCDVLGMTCDSSGQTVGYGGACASIHFSQAATDYRPSSTDIYWKIALGVPNIELAYDQLTARGVEVGEPHQFQNIGYLAHFVDPAGFTIELIEHWFQGNRPAAMCDRKLLGGGAHVNLLTLRTTDIEVARANILDWGMTPLSVQQVEDYAFTLHFFAFTDETPPHTDLESIGNREWVYQRPYTVLELQHLHSAGVTLGSTVSGQAGYIQTRVTGAKQALYYRPLSMRLDGM